MDIHAFFGLVARVDQLLEDLKVVVLAGEVDGRLELRVLHADVGKVLYEKIHELGVTFLDSNVQG